MEERVPTSIMNTCLLTIIVPVYNTARFIKECLESLVHQTSNEYCVLLIDDGSTDGSGVICDYYENHYSFIKVIHKDNGGLCSVRNLGIQNVETKWFAFVDSDDFISYNYVKTLLDPVHEIDDLDFVQAGCKKYVNEQEISVCQAYDYYLGKDKSVIFNKFRGLSCSKLFKTDIVRTNNLKFDPVLVYAEDYIFTMDYLYYIDKFCLSPELGYYYRQVEGSLSRKVCNDCDKLSYYVSQKYHFAERYITKNGLAPKQVESRLIQISQDLSWLLEILIVNKRLQELRQIHINYPLLVHYLSKEKKLFILLSYYLPATIAIGIIRFCNRIKGFVNTKK